MSVLSPKNNYQIVVIEYIYSWNHKLRSLGLSDYFSIHFLCKPTTMVSQTYADICSLSTSNLSNDHFLWQVNFNLWRTIPCLLLTQNYIFIFPSSKSIIYESPSIVQKGQFINVLLYMTLAQLSYIDPESPTSKNYNKYQHLFKIVF